MGWEEVRRDREPRPPSRTRTDHAHPAQLWPTEAPIPFSVCRDGGGTSVRIPSELDDSVSLNIGYMK